MLILGPVFLPGIGNQKTFVQRKENTGGVGYDLSGFVKTKAAGERILAMVHEVLGTDKCETYLDYRPSEPTWIQFKFQSSEFDLEKLDKLSREADRVVTKEILKQCLHGKSN